MSNGTHESTDAIAEINIESFRLLHIHGLPIIKTVNPHQGETRLTNTIPNPNGIIL